ncbi:hypothetical protein NHX12_001918 [Muraenolepis orangiensis]|uniref:SPIN-DOC-like zinc-finger domain-containing protein n=1 Tax=Muraenolepis orangiensis TaxID=630683 RepID=A0A9Q0IHQ2_9TELE|nr:hypothetical protein NHX12_001918 [Muraenolepis orangiensis]
MDPGNALHPGRGVAGGASQVGWGWAPQVGSSGGLGVGSSGGGSSGGLGVDSSGEPRTPNPCLICTEKVAVHKEYNIKRHYSTRHAEKYAKHQGDEREDRVANLKTCLLRQQASKSKESDAAVEASYVVSEMIAKAGKPFKDGEFIKKCMLQAASIVCPENKGQLSNISLSANTVAERMSDLSVIPMHGQTTALPPWKRFAGITTDGAPSMTGRRNGLVALVRRKLGEEGVEEAIALHYIIHQQALCSKYLKFDNAMSVVVKCINHIRSRGLKQTS